MRTQRRTSSRASVTWCAPPSAHSSFLPRTGQTSAIPTTSGPMSGRCRGCRGSSRLPTVAPRSRSTGAELAALLGRSTVGGEQLIRDAVIIRHRHPALWAAIKQGSVPVWVATKVGRRCLQAELDHEQAAWVDAETTPYVTTLPPSR